LTYTYVTHSYLGELNVIFDTHTHIYAYLGAPYLSLYMLTYMVYTYIFRRAYVIFDTHTHPRMSRRTIYESTYIGIYVAHIHI